MTLDDMTTEYERQRLLNISKNKDLLNCLSLANPKADDRPATAPPSRPAKRQKRDPLPPTRASARLSTQPKPSYTEEHTTPPASLSVPRKEPTPLPTPQPFSEEEVPQIWTWAATAPPPDRSENGTLYFADQPEVVPPDSTMLIVVHSKVDSRGDTSSRRLWGILLPSRILQNPLHHHPPRLRRPASRMAH